jgi:ornithine carbamoyltransferase
LSPVDSCRSALHGGAGPGGCSGRPPADAGAGDAREEARVKDLLRIADLTHHDLIELLDITTDVKEVPHAHRPLRRETVACYFAAPSTRTRLAFATAVTRLGGVPLMVGPADLQLGRGETIEDTARVVSRYARAFVVRTSSHEDVRRFAAAATVPVVNALTGRHHPCQTIADLFTLRERFGHLAGLRVAYVGDGGNVAHSLLEGCALAGVDLSVATPPGMEPSEEVVRVAEQLAVESGALISLGHEPHKAVAHADAVYTDGWHPLGAPEADRSRRAAALAPFRVTPELLAEASPRAVFLHALPASRGEEVSAPVIDGPRSLVLEQAENRLHTAQAVLLALVERRLKGSR